MSVFLGLSFPEFSFAKILGESSSARFEIALESLRDSGNDGVAS